MRLLFRYSLLVIGCMIFLIMAWMGIIRSANITSQWILFKSERDDQYALYRMHIDGSNVEHLADLPSHNWQVYWIMNGEWIILQEHNAGVGYRLKFDDMSREKLHLNDPRLLAISIENWSADGHAILFDWQYIGLFQLKVSRTELSEIHQAVVDILGVNFLSASPDNHSILLESGNDIFLYHFSDASPRKIWQKSVLAGDMHWSSDSQWIAFSSNYEASLEIYRMRSDGSNLERLTTSDPPNYNPVWSPDNQSLLFERQEGSNRDIYRLWLNDLSTQRLTTQDAIDREPYETMDKQWIIFETNRDGNWEIYRMRPDGSAMQNLSRNIANDQVIAPVDLPLLAWDFRELLILASILVFSSLISLRYIRFG